MRCFKCGAQGHQRKQCPRNRDRAEAEQDKGAPGGEEARGDRGEREDEQPPEPAEPGSAEPAEPGSAEPGSAEPAEPGSAEPAEPGSAEPGSAEPESAVPEAESIKHKRHSQAKTASGQEAGQTDEEFEVAVTKKKKKNKHSEEGEPRRDSGSVSVSSGEKTQYPGVKVVESGGDPQPKPDEELTSSPEAVPPCPEEGGRGTDLPQSGYKTGGTEAEAVAVESGDAAEEDGADGEEDEGIVTGKFPASLRCWADSGCDAAQSAPSSSEKDGCADDFIAALYDIFPKLKDAGTGGKTLLFEGTQDHLVPSAAETLTDSGLFEIAGRITGHSFLHGGPRMCGLSPSFARLFCGFLDCTTALSPEDCLDVDVKGAIVKLQCSEVVLDEKLKTEATAIGVHWDLPIVTVQNRYWYAQQLLVHAVVDRRQKAVQQVQKGLKECGILEMVQRQPTTVGLLFPPASEADIDREAGSQHELKNLIKFWIGWEMLKFY
ncbi:UNVERIFIED_CONTAM: hypothetical protein FKN15_011574 [Acipenser sinensis]